MISVMNTPRFFLYNGTFITESLHKRPNQSLASIHWLTYRPTVFGAVGLCRLWWVCVWCIVGAHSLCSRQHVAYSL